MRTKIKVTNTMPQLEFGKTYILAYAGVTMSESFTFTRKNRIELRDERIVNGEVRKVSSYWVSKRYLKELLQSGAIHWIGEYHKP